MAGTRRPPEADLRDALILGAAIGFLLGVIAGAFLCGL